jgi:hypothetical protein
MCILHLSFSQDISKCWNLTIYDDDFSPEHPKPTWTYYGLKTGADTLIGEVSYKKLYKSNDSLFSVASIIGGIREDSNRIYLSKSVYSPDEILLYDFNMDTGDTLIVNRLIRIEHHSYYSLSAKVDSINTIELNGESKKRLYLTYNCIDGPGEIENDIWVEGIGSIFRGLLNPSCKCLTGCYSRSYLTCYSENDLLIWRDSTFEDCYVYSHGIADNIKQADHNNLISMRSEGNMVQVKSSIPILSVKAMNLGGSILFENNHLNSNYYEFTLKDQWHGLMIVIVNNRHTYKLFY